MIDYNMFLAIAFLGKVLQKIEPDADWNEFANYLQNVLDSQTNFKKSLDKLETQLNNLSPLKEIT